MEEQAEDEEILWSGLKEALEGAFEQFVETRTLEGTHLKEDILEKLFRTWKLWWDKWSHVLLRSWQSIVQSWKRR